VRAEINETHSMSESPMTVRLIQHHDYQFDNHFGERVPRLLTDEPTPLGRGAGPSPVQLLAASVGNCLAASLLFALRKYKQVGEPIECGVDVEVGRNADKRLRVVAMTARLTIGVPAEGVEHLQRILTTFEDFCTVTGSVRQAFPVTVEVFDARGAKLT
jgi:uncharacterized OsmC-like protein